MDGKLEANIKQAEWQKKKKNLVKNWNYDGEDLGSVWVCDFKTYGFKIAIFKNTFKRLVKFQFDF
jgi:hypothetical protein